jgi:hypothetical protein
LLQGWNSLLDRPEPLLIKDIKVQVNKQKPNNVRPAQMKHNSELMRRYSSSPNFAKPPVVSRLLTRSTMMDLITIGVYSNIGILISSDFLFEE